MRFTLETVVTDEAEQLQAKIKELEAGVARLRAQRELAEMEAQVADRRRQLGLAPPLAPAQVAPPASSTETERPNPFMAEFLSSVHDGRPELAVQMGYQPPRHVDVAGITNPLMRELASAYATTHPEIAEAMVAQGRANPNASKR
jgi:hypothetical protein